jgi:hypothetical protein
MPPSDTSRRDGYIPHAVAGAFRIQPAPALLFDILGRIASNYLRRERSSACPRKTGVVTKPGHRPLTSTMRACATPKPASRSAVLNSAALRGGGGGCGSFMSQRPIHARAADAERLCDVGGASSTRTTRRGSRGAGFGLLECESPVATPGALSARVQETIDTTRNSQGSPRR